MLNRISRIVGFIGVIIFAIVFARTPSFPTPDKILVFATLVAMAYGQARELLKRFVPFVALLLVYESFRGLAPMLNGRVNYLWMPAVDRLMFLGHLPTVLLQDVLWHGNVTWYDFVFYGAYTLHFVIPFGLAVLVWKTREKHYWEVITAFLVLSFAGFLTYVLFPAAPPWMASDKGLIEPIARVSSSVWAAFGIHDFPSVYNKISPNPVAAVPSLHAAYAALFAIYLTRFYKSRWTLLSWIYPILIWVGTVYMGEHYIIDAILGVLYAVVAYWTAPSLVRWLSSTSKKLLNTFHNMLS